LYSGCDAVITEFSAGEKRLLTLGHFQTCQSWKMWNSFGDSSAAVALCIATNELRRAHVAMKQWGRRALRLRSDRLRRFIFSASPSQRLHTFIAALVVVSVSSRFCSSSAWEPI